MTIGFSLLSCRSVIDASELLFRAPTAHPERENPPFHDFFLLKTGMWDLELEGEEFPARPGDVVILPAGSRYRGVLPCQAGTETVFFHVLALPEDRLFPEKEEDFPGGLSLPPLLHCQGDPLIRELFEEIVTLKCSGRAEKEAMMSAVFQSLLCFLDKRQSATVIGNRDLVDACTERMRLSPGVIFKEAEMAKMLFVSPRTLRDSFLRRYNKTFYRYQLDGKLDQAFHLLSNDRNARVNQVAESLGFCDAFHLSRLFKRKFGISPSAVRTSANQKGEV